jgi:hypothetical protein
VPFALSALVIASGVPARDTPPLRDYPECRPAADNQPARPDQPTRVCVNTTLLSLNKIDVSSGTFTADFYLDLTCNSACGEKFFFANGRDDILSGAERAKKFELMNGRLTSVELLSDGQRSKQYRVQADMWFSANLARFPFDEYRLPIEIEDQARPETELQFAPSSAVTASDLSTGGWERAPRERDSLAQEVTSSRYVSYGRTQQFSRYTTYVSIGRGMISSMMKVFVPAGVIMAGALVYLGYLARSRARGGPGSDNERGIVVTTVAVVAAALIAVAQLHVSAVSPLPPIGYLTFADRFMVLNYIWLMVGFYVCVALLIAGPARSLPAGMRARTSGIIIGRLPYGFWPLAAWVVCSLVLVGVVRWSSG